MRSCPQLEYRLLLWKASAVAVKVSRSSKSGSPLVAQKWGERRGEKRNFTTDLEKSLEFYFKSCGSCSNPKLLPRCVVNEEPSVVF
ncbi:hypothetical protein CDAR_397531 [Caerostris darwini]|uniref:Uncharacterized protein n=1 Tax=Caerostris darwini TaxID=1538125 RepID=A0AAV4T8E0_9ARAC|nr:hypothetical protein CDAR_397531 [Caerostris darwini]